MKKYSFAIIAIVLSVFFYPQKEKSSKDEYRELINQHPYTTREKLTPKQIKELPKQDRPDLAWEQDFLATMDPSLGRPAPERLKAVYQQVAQATAQFASTPGAVGSPWVERGPNNVGGRTRALAFDPSDITHKKVWAGGVTGGLWYNTDITSSSNQWIAVNDFWDNIAISAIAFDPNNSSIIYVGTGEGWGAGSSRGAGIWKSTNGGTSWTQLSASSSFYYINDLAVRDESGTSVLYAAVRGNYYGQTWHGSSSEGLQRSVNGGTSFSQVLPNVPGETFNYVAADIEIGANNTIWIGTTTASWSGTDRGGGRVLKSTNGTTWSVSHTSTGGERVEVACAPSDANYVYALVESGNVLDKVLKTTNGGTSWSSMSEPSDADNGIPNSDFTRGQAWYDLIIAVDPNNKNTVIAGGIDLFRSTNGASSWSQISKWSNNNNLFGLNCALVHADQHAIVFSPGSSSKVIFGNDGGVFYTSSVSTAATNSVIQPRNSGYNVTQFYATAIHPMAGMDYFLAGSQDNGTQKMTSIGVGAGTQATGGDGAFCFIDQTDANYQITSYVYNSYWRSINGGASFQNPRFQNDQTTGRFINPADYDDNLNILYSARTNSTVNRVKNITGTPTIGNFTVTGMSSKASHLRVSPYTTSSTTLFVGTDAGDLYKVTNADGGSPSSTSIGSALPSGYISCVEIGANENELLVTLTNYGVNSVWYTSNGGSTWVSKEGNLPDMPVRWALFNPNDRTNVILATEVGVWSTSNFSATSPSWSPSNSGLANVRVDMLQIRQSDFEVVAATFGRGIFTSSGFVTTQPPVASMFIDKTYPCVNETVQLSDSSTGNPTSWQWTITPSTYNFVSSNANSQHPEVNFTASGWYSVKMVVTNANGSDSVVNSQAIHVGGHTLPFSEDFETNSVSEWQVSNPDNSYTWSLGTVGGNTPGNKAAMVDNYNYNGVAQVDALFSPAIDLTGYTQVTLDFEYAYRRYSAGNADSLKVLISTDCGTTWSILANYGENGTGNFATGSDYTSVFTPAAASDWCGSSGNPVCPSIDISSYAGGPGVVIRFDNINGYGNNMFVDNINITGATLAAPVADFSAASTSVCQGANTIFTDLSTNSPTSWAWTFSPNTVTYLGGTSASSQNPQVQFNSAGNYQVSLSSTNAIGSDSEVKSSYITVTASSTPTISATASATAICSGTTVNFSSSVTNEGSSPSYQWKVNGSNVGTNSPTYSSNSLAQGDAVTVELTSNKACVTSSTAVSTAINMSVTASSTPTVNITASSTSVCTGATVNFSSSVTNEGTSPSYQWKVNGSNVGTNSPSYSSSSLSNNDVVTLVLTSNKSCVSSTTVTSTGITMTVTASSTPTISASTSASTACSGSLVNFTSSVTNEGANPIYQWKVNGNNVGTNSATYSSNTLLNGDVVTVELTSNKPCVTSSTASSSPITMTIISTPTVTINTSSGSNLCDGDSLPLLVSVNNHGVAGSGVWSGPGVVGNNFVASLAGSGQHTIVYTYTTTQGLCSGSDNITVNTEIVPMPTVSLSNMVLSCAQAGFTYQWIKDGLPIAGSTSQTHTVVANGTYEVELSKSGCSKVSSSTIVNNFGMDDLISAVDFKLYPNPSQGTSYFEMINPGVSTLSYKLISFNGAVVQQKTVKVGAKIKESVDMKDLANGVYMLQISIGNQEINKRLTKM